MTEKPIVLELRHILKKFDQTQVLKGIDLVVHEGEFITLLGSSGCGKTTTLRLIAGLDVPDEGQVLLEGEDVTMIPPHARNVNTVFQNYALFPHMTVYDNVAYGLKLRKVNKKEIRERVTKMLALVMLDGFEKRYPAEMSGGQKQRVAIARSLINNPRVLLLDEPLGALDLQLRRQMQYELKRLQKKLGITFIYITHDQEEALNMSDRIAVMKDGKFEQIGSPQDIYERPKTSYVAQFVGSANVLEGEAVCVENGRALLRCAAGFMRCACPDTADAIQPGKMYRLAIRSESIELCQPGQCENKYHMRGYLSEKSYAGGMLRMSVTLSSGETIEVSRHGINYPLQPQDEVCICWDAASAVFVDLDASGVPDNPPLSRIPSPPCDHADEKAEKEGGGL